MVYLLEKPTQVQRQLVIMLSKVSNGSCLDSYGIKNELMTAFESGSLVIIDQRPRRVKVFTRNQNELVKFCIEADCNTRSLMQNNQESSLHMLLNNFFMAEVVLEKFCPKLELV
jgi:hypothetical protein